MGWIVELGDVVGIIVVQLIGELGIQLMLWIFYVGGIVLVFKLEFEIVFKFEGKIEFDSIWIIEMVEEFGEEKDIVLFCIGEIWIVDVKFGK